MAAAREASRHRTPADPYVTDYRPLRMRVHGQEASGVVPDFGLDVATLRPGGGLTAFGWFLRLLRPAPPVASTAVQESPIHVNVDHEVMWCEGCLEIARLDPGLPYVSQVASWASGHVHHHRSSGSYPD
jgi:hypothetical protein